MLTSAFVELWVLFVFFTMLIRRLAAVSCFDHFLGLHKTRLSVGVAHHLDVMLSVSGRCVAAESIFGPIDLLSHCLGIAVGEVGGGLNSPPLETFGSVDFPVVVHRSSCLN